MVNNPNIFSNYGIIVHKKKIIIKQNKQNNNP